MLVTGGSRGIGRAVVRMLAEAGASVGVAYFRDRESAEAIVATAASIAPAQSFWCEPADLSTEPDCARLFGRVDDEFGGLDGFVGNAGIWNSDARPLADLDLAEWNRMLSVNLTSIYLTTRAAASRMEAGAKIVLLSSTAAQRGEAQHSHYAASKGAINSFTKSIATELGPRGINVNAVAPGWVDTDMSASVLQTEERAAIERGIPLGRIASAEDLAGPTVFLLSELSRHITGEILNVNGGSVLCG